MNDTLSKEEILDKCLPDLIEYPHYALDNFQISVAYDAMDRYAKQDAIEFAKWAIANHYMSNEKTYGWYIKSKQNQE